MTRLSPDAYDAALARLGAFIKEHHYGASETKPYAMLSKPDTLVFLELVAQTGFGYLLSEADCLVTDPDDDEQNDMVTLPLSFESQAFETMRQRVNLAPSQAGYVFYDFAPDGRLADVVQQGNWDSGKDWEPLVIPDFLRKTH